jgi:hypothetical protein
MQLRGTPLRSSKVISPTFSKEFTILGRHYGPIAAISISYLSHYPDLISIRCVRLAFDASVTYFPVNIRATHVSIVPNLTLPYLAFYFRPYTFSNSHRILNKEK